MKRLLIIYIILAIYLLTGCGNNDTGTHSSVPGLTKSPDTSPLGELTVKPLEGGTITLGVTGYSTLNPLSADNEDIKYYMSLVYDPLYKLDYQQNETPCLATAASTQDGGLNWTITLRNDVKWHNGYAFTAADCVYTVNYIKNNGGLYEFCTENIASCTLQDEFTVNMELKKPDMYMPGKLIFPVIPSFTADIGNSPVGTSIYKYQETEGNKIILTRNNDYWGEKPYIDTVEIIRYNNERLKYESESDMFILSGDYVSRYFKKAGYMSHKYTGRSFTCLMPNLKNNNVLKDVNVRKALMYAIDNTNVINSAISGYGINAAWPIVPGTRYFQDTASSRVRDLEKAYEHLENAGYKKNEDGRWYKTGDTEKKYPLTVPCVVMSGDIQMRKCAEAVKKQVEETGIIFTVVYNSDSDYEKTVRSGSFTLAAVKMDIGAWPDLEPLFNPGGRMNLTGYSNKALTDLMSGLFTSDNISEKMTEIKTILDHDLPLIGLYISYEVVVMSERIMGNPDEVYFWNPFNGFNDLHLHAEGVITK